MKTKTVARMLGVITLLGVNAYSVAINPIQVEAAASYQVKLTKNAYIYTLQGKKTKTSYPKK